MELLGDKVILRPMTPTDIPLFYKWATQSDATPFWYGELYKNKVPTYKEFLKDWQPHYFDGSKPEEGRSFKITALGKPIGQINYNKINANSKSVELDILIADDLNKGKGYGSDALKTLTKYLFQNFDIETCWIEAVTDNPRAIGAYKKAGFQSTHSVSKNGVKFEHLEISRSKV